MKTSEKIVAVTACPTGIAHTIMAAEALKKTAEVMGYDIKVETQGSEGVKSPLSQEDIADADLVIIGAVSMWMCPGLQGSLFMLPPRAGQYAGLYLCCRTPH